MCAHSEFETPISRNKFYHLETVDVHTTRVLFKACVDWHASNNFLKRTTHGSFIDSAWLFSAPNGNLWDNFCLLFNGLHDTLLMLGSDRRADGMVEYTEYSKIRKLYTKTL
ncbi:unnamed protein product [Porites lobata]|uniref:Uncharacterized protein n=1 Tax=Porites lobata TaxID=104759 RepID=A0ABN8NRN0_9CNID|nr:unnamed protein product [Porites lobata]